MSIDDKLFWTAALICGAILTLCSGCTTRTVEYQGVKYSHRSFAVKASFGKIKIKIPEGPEVTIENYNSDQVSAVGVAVDAAVSAAMKSALPVPALPATGPKK